MHAFIIEDEYLIARSLQDMLEKLGFSRFSFARSEDAAVMGAGAAGANFDLITADIRLLPGDGFDAIQTIMRQRQIPVIFITGYAAELEDRAPDALVLQKPIKQEELAEIVQRALGAAHTSAAR
jgi:CheY-like chemotaxis protein